MFLLADHLGPIQLRSKHLPVAFVEQEQAIVFSQDPESPLGTDQISLRIAHNQR